jgi:hypothetical protein
MNLANEGKPVIVQWRRTQCPLFINLERARGGYFSLWAADRLPTTLDVSKNTGRTMQPSVAAWGPSGWTLTASLVSPF